MSRGIRTLLSTAAALTVALGAPAAAGAVCPEAPARAATLSDDQFRAEILCLINEQRALAGRRPVRPDGKLRRASQRHSTAMVSRGFFAHVTPSGRGIIDRIKGTGYMRRASDWYVGENLGWGSGSMSTPASIVGAWVQSPPHAENLLNRNFEEIGVGISRGSPASATDPSAITVTTDYGWVKR